MSNYISNLSIIMRYVWRSCEWFYAWCGRPGIRCLITEFSAVDRNHLLINVPFQADNTDLFQFIDFVEIDGFVGHFIFPFTISNKRELWYFLSQVYT